MKKFDKLWLGFSFGMIAPLIFIIVIYFREAEFVKLLFTSFLRIGLLINLAVFLLAFYTGFDRIPKGILAATIIYGLVIVYFYIWPL